MGKKKYPYNKLNSKQAYNAKELETLLSVHQQTIRKLWKREGLEPMEASKKPLLYWGADVKGFLKRMEEKRKFNTEPYDFSCMKCQKATQPKNGIVYLSQKNNGSYCLSAVCATCQCKISKFVAKKDIGIFSKHYEIKPLEEMAIYKTDNSSVKTHIKHVSKTMKNESFKNNRKPTAQASLNKNAISSVKTHINEQLCLF